ncbi:MAG: hypothetical protein U1C48_02275 [Methylotenera sp.]|nr:hypothetical protein [Methylotenera sp.]
MNWLVQNWVWVLVFAVFIWMHMSGHGCHGGHGSHHDERDQRPTDGEEPSKNRPQGHQH